MLDRIFVSGKSTYESAHGNLSLIKMCVGFSRASRLEGSGSIPKPLL